jgi:hypothetical protein
MAVLDESYPMPSAVIALTNVSSVERSAAAVPEVATAASPSAPATRAVPASVVTWRANIVDPPSDGFRAVPD